MLTLECNGLMKLGGEVKLEMQSGTRTISYLVEDSDVLRSRAALLIRARSKAGFSREELAAKVKPRQNISYRLIQRIEYGEVLMPEKASLQAIAETLGIDRDALVIPPAAVVKCLANLGDLLEMHGGIYGEAYATRFANLRRPTMDFAEQLGRGIIDLPDPEAADWLEDLYRSARNIRCLMAPRFIEMSC